MSDFGIGVDLVASANAVAAFLALDDLDRAEEPSSFDLIVLAGNAILATATGAFAWARQAGTPLLISGGIGHSTALLAEAVAAEPSCRGIAVRNRPEAEILRDIGVQLHGLDEARILIEPASTNCGENAAFSLCLLDERGMRPRRLLLIQDPLMQRRTDASFRQVWAARGREAEFVNWPTFTPRLEAVDGEVRHAQPPAGPLWSGQRFMSLLLGEIPRLRDDEHGYGPRGRGFIAHVAVPDAVEAHYRALAAHFEGKAPALSRSIGPR